MNLKALLAKNEGGIVMQGCRKCFQFKKDIDFLVLSGLEASKHLVLAKGSHIS